jgi:DNA-binding NarL/FixJ family response regulator
MPHFNKTCRILDIVGNCALIRRRKTITAPEYLRVSVPNFKSGMRLVCQGFRLSSAGQATCYANKIPGDTMNESADNLARFDRVDSPADPVISLFVIARKDIYIDGLVRVISDFPGHRVVACSNPDGDCLETFRRTPADLLLIEQSILEEHLQDATHHTLLDDFREVFPGLRFIVFGRDISDYFLHRMLRVGIRGFIDKTTTEEQLAGAIREVHDGGFWLGQKLLEQVIHSSVEVKQIIEQGIQAKIELIRETLTRRESEVLQRVLEGMTNREIADDLNLSEQSIKLHLGRLFRKFEVSNRSQLILMTFQRVSPTSDIIKQFREVLDKHR